MPLLDYQKKQLLINRGLNPSEWDIDEQQMIPIPKESPDIIEQPTVAPESQFPRTTPDSSLTTFGKSFAQAAPSSIGGGLGAWGGLAGGTALASALAVPSGGLSFLIPLLSAIGGGFGGGAITRKAQEVIEPQEWQQNVAKSAQQNPLAAIIGSLSTIPLGGFNPNIPNVVKAIGNASKIPFGLAGGAPLSQILKPNELSNLLNVGAGAGIGAGANVIEQIGSQEPFSIPHLLESAGIGALFNKPNPIGRAYGFHSATTPELHDTLTGKLLTDAEVANVNQLQTTPEGIPVDQVIRTGGAPIEQGSTLKPVLDKATNTLQWKQKSYPLTESGLRRLARDSSGMYDFTQTPEPPVSPTQLQTFEGEGGPSVEQPVTSGERTSDFLLAQIEQKRQQERQILEQANQLQEGKLAHAQQQLRMAMGQQGTLEAISGRTISRPENIPAEQPAALQFVKPFTEEGQPNYTVEQQIANQQVAQESPAELALRRIEERLSGQQQSKYSEGSELPQIRTKLQEDLLSSGEILSYSPTREWLNVLTKWIGNVKGIKVNQENEIISEKTKQPISGQTLLEEGIPQLIRISTTKGRADTPMHELYHAFVAALRKSDRPYDRKLVNEYDRIVSESPDYQSWKAQRDAVELDSTPEEYQATNQGYQFIKTHLNVAGEKPLKKWWNDFNSYLKTRFTKHATPEDYQRLLDYRLTNEQRSIPSYFSKENVPTINPNIVTKESDKELFPTKDIESASKFAKMRESVDNLELQKQAQKDILKEDKTSQVNPNVKYSESSELTPEHSNVRSLIDTITTKTDDATIKPEDARRIYSTLTNKVNWEKMPQVEEALSNVKDILDPTTWNHVQDVYNKSINQPKEVVIKPLAAEAPVTKNIEVPRTNIKPKAQKVETTPPVEEPAIIPTEEPTVPKSGIKPISKWSPEDVKFGRMSDSEYQKRLDSKTPQLEAKNIRDEYTLLYHFTNEMRAAELMHRPKYDDAITRMQQLKRLYNEITTKNPTIEPQEIKYSESSELLGTTGKESTIVDETKESEKSYLPAFIRPDIEKIRPESPVIADGFTKFFERKRAYLGSLTNNFLGKVLPLIPKLNLKEQLTQNTPDFDSVVQRRFDMQDKKNSNIVLTPAAKRVDDILTESLQKALDLKNSFPTLRKTLEGNPNYFPHIPKGEVLDAILNHPQSPEAKKLLNDWYDHYKNVLGESPEAAKQNLKIFMAGYRKQEVNLAQQFGPIDEAAGLGLPRLWRETNMIHAMNRFFDRYGRRIAYEEAIKTNPDVMEALTNDETGLGASDAVKNVMEDISGVRINDEALRTAISGVVTSSMLGPLTGAKDLVTSPFLGMQHKTFLQSLISPFKSIADINTNTKESFKAGVNRHNLMDLQFGDGGIQGWVSALRTVRNVISKLQGRNWLEQLTRGMAFGEGKFLAMDNLWAAKNRNLSRQGKDFLDNFGPEDWRTYVTKGEFPPDVLQEIAAQYVESVQGTYDPRGLPSISRKGSFAPYLSLARWNIEKLNNFDKYVVQPAFRGNIIPLLMSTLGMFIGGEAVNQLVQVVTKRKEKTPTYKELAAIAEEPEGKLGQAVLYKLAGLASLAGYGGLVGDLSKAGMDTWFKNRAQTYNNPLITGAESIGRNVVDAVEALKNGDLNIGADVLSQVMEDFFQGYRITLAQLDPEKKQQIEESNTLRDLKLFKTTTGLPVGEVTTDRANPFLNKNIKRFKKTSDIGEAVELLPQLLEHAFTKADGNIDTLQSELKKIKQNNYQTFPNPDNMPLTFIRYLNRLSKSQSPEIASERLNDYILKNTINKVKAELVPSL
jgi:hypothetical protein